jgi:hypothetical protein
VSATTRLRVDRILVDAFGILWRRRRVFLTGLAFPGAAIVALQSAFWYFDPEPPWASWLAWGARSLLWVIFAVICHRLVLLDPHERDVGTVPRWSWRETRFVGWVVAAYGLAMLATWLVILVGATLFGWMLSLVRLEEPFLSVAVPAAGALSMTYLFARFAAVLPATAIDAQSSLKLAWEQTRGNGLRMVVIAGALPWLVRYATWRLYSDEPTLLEVALVTAAGTVLIAFEIAALSLAYRELSSQATSGS